MNRPWLYAQEVIDKFHANYMVQGLTAKMRELHPYLVEMEQIAYQKKIPVRDAFQGTLPNDRLDRWELFCCNRLLREQQTGALVKIAPARS
jgi:hypothetical protein